jgi:serine/threonine protein kinase
MGTVYDVEDTTVGKRYVLKTLHAELSSRKDLAKRMEVEARTLARLSHPNIVEVVTAGATTDELRLPYYVMEKLNGQNLRTILSKKGSLDLPHALHIAIDLLDALDNAHDKGVIHRDVKPDNIFLHRNPNGVTTTKLLDFGIMRLLDAGPGVTAGRFMGTLRYAAAEQLRGEPLSLQIDLYAAALVLYEMVAGCGPFDDLVDPNKIAAAHIQTAPPPLLSWGVVVPELLEKLLVGALAKEPSKRPKDAFTFAAQLRNLKRTLQEDRTPESETSRPTEIPVAGLVTGPSGSLPEFRPRFSSSEPFSTSGASPQAYATTAEHANSRPVHVQRTPAVPAFPYTMIGMTPLSATGPTLVNATASDRRNGSEVEGGQTSGDTMQASRVGALDRNASTHSVAIEIPWPFAGQGTHPIAVVSTDTAETEPWQPRHTLRMDLHPQARAAGAECMDHASDLLALLPAIESVVVRSDAAASNTLAPVRSSPSRPLLAIVAGLLATGAMIATLVLAVWGVRRHGNAQEAEGKGIGEVGAVAAPATAPFAAPILAPPLDINPWPTPSAPMASTRSELSSAPASAPLPLAPTLPPAAPSVVNPGTTAEAPQRLRAHADSSTMASSMAEPRSDLNLAPALPSPRPPASSRPSKRKLPGSGL